MTDVPEDINRAAHIAVMRFETRIQSGEFDGLDPDGTEARDALISEVQRVLTAERARCAKIAEMHDMASGQSIAYLIRDLPPSSRAA
jgi:hypothetical protein